MKKLFVVVLVILAIGLLISCGPGELGYGIGEPTPAAVDLEYTSDLVALQFKPRSYYYDPSYHIFTEKDGSAPVWVLGKSVSFKYDLKVVKPRVVVTMSAGKQTTAVIHFKDSAQLREYLR